jgi:hypothetical protein
MRAWLAKCETPCAAPTSICRRKSAYNEIRARANTRYAPLTVARILDNRDLDIMASSQMVEGAFTRDAWNGYVKAAIDEASKGEIRGMTGYWPRPFRTIWARTAMSRKTVPR